MNPGLFTVTLDAEESIPCLLIFKPTEVASYDFFLPVTINQTSAPTPHSTPFPPTSPNPKKSIDDKQAGKQNRLSVPASAGDSGVKHIICPRPQQVDIVTPRRRVFATALRQPLTVSHHSLRFTITPAVHELAAASGIGQSKVSSVNLWGNFVCKGGCGRGNLKL